MSLITYNGLVELVEQGVIEGVDPSHINAASIDVTMGVRVWLERAQNLFVDLAQKNTPAMVELDLQRGPLYLGPGEFALAQTREVFHLPDNIAAEFRLKSSGARSGLDQALAVWCDPGWHGSVLTLELRNNLQYQTLVLTTGMKIGQMVFWRGEAAPAERSYRARGQYNNDRTSTPSKGIR